MRRGSGLRRAAWGLATAIALGSAANAAAFEFLDGRLQVHGFFEEQVRTLARDFDTADDFDLAQWYHVLNVEVELDVAPDGWGPFDLVSTFVRLEGRYDCVWTRGCGMLRGANTYGDRAEHLPGRVSDARRPGFTGTLFTGDTRQRHGIPRVTFGQPPGLVPGDPSRRLQPDTPAAGLDFPFKDTVFGDGRKPGQWFNTPVLDDLFNNAGVDTLFGNADDPAPFYFSPVIENCLYAFRDVKGPENGVGTQPMVWNPGCKIRSLARLRGKPNVFAPDDYSPILSGDDRLPGTADDPVVGVDFDGDPVFVDPVGFGALPFRPAPDAIYAGSRFVPRRDPATGQFVRAGPDNIPGTGDEVASNAPIFLGQYQGQILFDEVSPTARASDARAQGMYYTNRAVARLVRQGAFDSFDQNFRQAEFEWNRGASQQDEKELKEAYVDLEMFDSRLWIRLGKQSIVWGKTELFRTTDQFNPQDIALATLPELEESRIALWSARGVWSFYGVGPFEDVRLELAMNYDQFEPTDIGRCGEPFAPNPVCTKTFGLLLHGVFGEGLAGEIRPPDPWNSLEGVEAGARLEWRWGRFSFQLSDFYGYDDFPFLDIAFAYERNVDLLTGRPLRGAVRGSCSRNPGDLVDIDGDGNPEFERASDPDCLTPDRALDEHHANQLTYAVICSTSIGFFPTIDPTVCAQSVLNSQSDIVPGFVTVATLLSGVVAGSPTAEGVVEFQLLRAPPIAPGTPATPDAPLVQLNQDLNDGAGSGILAAESISARLTDEQEALLGCGPFFGTDCDLQGLDLLNAEASAVLQAWPGFEGTVGDWATDDASRPQPATLGFEGGPVATRWNGLATVVLPGARSPFPGEDDLDPDLWSAGVDGCPASEGTLLAAGVDAAAAADCVGASDLLHPYTGQQFRSEMAVVSWNALTGIGVSLSSAVDVFMADGSQGEDDIPDVRQAAVGGDPEAKLPIDRFDNGAGLPAGFFNPDGTIRAEFAADYGPMRTNGCSFVKPQLCNVVQGLFLVTGQQRNSRRAGSNGRFGRTDFLWHGGASAVLRYDKRNVLGFAFDFAEDWTKSNWSAELTWIDDIPARDHDEFDNLTEVDTLNLTLSVDRPTFINFLNPNRTFFLNSQWFFQYVDGYTKGFPSAGPFNVLFTLTAETGYFDDRLQPRMTGVYDFRSNSGGLLPRITYRFSSNFSATVGMNVFWGRFESKRAPLTQVVLSKRVERGANRDFVENALSAVRDRDEVYLRIRYTF